jgi:WD40 repeat protein
MATVGLISAALILGLVVSTWQAIRATKAESTLAKSRDNERQLRADAETERDRAIDAERLAEEERNRAEAQRDENRNLLYKSDIARALYAWQDGLWPEAMRLVERHRPGPDERDLRGFEWYYLWRLCAKESERPSLPHPAMVWSMDFSPDGESLATVDALGNFALWSVSDFEMISRQKKHEARAAGAVVAFSPDGQTLVTAGRIGLETGGVQGGLRFWDAGSGQLIETIELRSPRGASPSQISFSPDGKTLAAACMHSVEFVDVASRHPLSEQRIGEVEGATSVAFAVDGGAVAYTHGGIVKILDLHTRETVTLGEGNGLAYLLAFSPDGHVLAAGESNGAVKVWDTKTWKLLSSFQAFDSPIASMEFSPDSRSLATGGTSIKLWEAASGTQTEELQSPGTALAFAPSGEELATIDVDNAVRFKPLRDPANRTSSEGTSDVTLSVAVSPDDALVASGSVGGRVELWDVFSGNSVTSVDKTAGDAVAFSPDGKYLVALKKYRKVTFRDARDLSFLGHLMFPRPGFMPLSFAFSPNGQKVVAGDANGWIATCDLTDYRFDEPIEKQTDAVTGLVFAPDGRWLAGIVGGDEVKMWDAGSGKTVTAQGRFGQPTGKPAFSPDGRLLACGSVEGKIAIWNPATGNLLASFEAHVGEVRSVIFSPDGDILISAANDGEIHLWDVGIRERRATLKTTQRSAVLSCAITGTGNTLVSAGFGQPVRFWRGTSAEDLTQLRDRLRLEQQVDRIWKAVSDDDGKPQGQGRGLMGSLLDRFRKAASDGGELELQVSEFMSDMATDAGRGLTRAQIDAITSVAHALRSSDTTAATNCLLQLADTVQHIESPLYTPGQNAGKLLRMNAERKSCSRPRNGQTRSTV